MTDTTLDDDAPSQPSQAPGGDLPRQIPSSAADRRSRRAVWAALALVLVPAVALVGLEIYRAVSVVPDLRQSQDLVVHTLSVIDTARSLEDLVQDAEGAQRGYLITGNDAYLEPYRAALAGSPDRILQLRRLTLDNPNQQKCIDHLQAEIEERFGQLRQTLDARRKFGFDAARQAVETNTGQMLAHEVSGLIGAVIAEERQLLGERQRRSVKIQQIAAGTGLVSAGLAFAVILLGGFLLARASFGLLRSQQALRQSEERFRLLVSGVKDYAIFMVDPEGRVVSWNEGAERIKGYAADEIIGRHFSRFYPPEEIAEGMPRRLLDKAAAEGRVEIDGWRVRKDGSHFFANIVLTALQDTDGNLRGFAKVVRDITERRQNETVMEQQRTALAQYQKMESLGQLTGGVAHDFNNLLTTILGSCDLVQHPANRSDPQQTRRLMGMVQRAAEQGAALTQRLPGVCPASAAIAAARRRQPAGWLDVGTFAPHARR